MSDLAIRAEGIGKSYRLSHVQPQRMLREDLVSFAKAPFRAMLGRTRKPLETFWALRDVSFEIRQGEVIGIVGRNGAGKSTLLKLLSRISEPTTGNAEMHGRIGSLLEVGTGFHSELTGRENIFLNGAILGMKQREIRAKFDEIVAFAEVDKFLDTPVKRYSSGMYVRLAFAVAAHLEPEILIVDEVLAVGDAQFQKKCLGKMEDVAAGGRTVLFVSHNLSAIRRLCPKSMMLVGGKLLDFAATDTIIDLYMKDSAPSAMEFTKPADPANPVSIVRVAVLDRNDQPAATVEHADGFTLEIDYEVHKPLHDTLLWAAIRTMLDIEVFSSADYDSDASLLGERQPGRYRARVVIPGALLNVGSYYVVVGAACQQPLVGYERIQACSFSVVDNASYPIAEGATRTGLVKPRFAWRSSRIG